MRQYQDSAFWKFGKGPLEDRTIYGLEDSNGRLQGTTSKVVEVAFDYYSGLFAQEPTDRKSQDRLLNLMQAGDFSQTEGRTTSDEVLRAVRGWANDKSPGSDAIPYEFFKQYVEYGAVGRRLLDVLVAYTALLICLDKYDVSILSVWAKGCIKVMYKKGDKLDIKNYRPLSMTNALRLEER